ncbi:DHH family phosphoesterase [Nakamurella sp. UYEF19]|uniref:DHH family phosphoesterase n=1 Tax=Nakamurella sp. UYEF19 TaxID=1756392 RepID=UPI003396A12F
MQSDLAAACDLIRAASSVVLLAHVSPDADALGSAFALGLALDAAGWDVTVAFSEPSTVPMSLRGLPGQRLVKGVQDVPEHPDLVICLDVNSRERLGSLGALLETAGDSLVIDHHASNTRFGSNHLVDIAAESTTVLVAAMLDRLGLPIDRAIADNIYAGLATDTVGFRFASSAAHRLAARLLDAGVNPDELMRPITDLHPFGWLDMLSWVLGSAALDRQAAGGRGLVSTVIGRGIAVGLRQEELDSVIDILRTASEAQVAAVLKETSPGQWQVSLRSRPGPAPDGASVPSVDVAAVASELGGGGHVRAAGFGFDGTADDALAALVAALA